MNKRLIDIDERYPPRIDLQGNILIRSLIVRYYVILPDGIIYERTWNGIYKDKVAGFYWVKNDYVIINITDIGDTELVSDIWVEGGGVRPHGY